METLNEKKGSKVPHSYVIIAAFVLVMAILTYIIPAGNYEMIYNEEIDREIVDPNSFTYTERTPVSPLMLLTSVTLGM